MKNRILSLMALTMFATSLISASPVSFEEDAVDCTAVAAGTQAAMQKKGYSHLAANDAANAAYDSCIENGGTPNGL